MENQLQKNTFDFSSLNLFVYIVKRFKILAFVSILAALVSVIVSLLITPKFKSSVIIFPASSISVSQVLLSNYTGAKGGITSFGEEAESEQLLQILNSDQIISYILLKYKLMEHYDISPSARYKKTLLYSEYYNNIKFRRTEFNSIEISVLDKDPEIAANIANDISDMLDTVMNRLVKQRARRAFAIVERQYQERSDSIKAMEANMTNRKTGLFADKNNSKNYLRDQLKSEYKILSDLKTKYAEAKVDASQDIPCKFVLDRAYPAEKKSYPIRSLIVLVSTFSAFVLALIVALIYDNLRPVFAVKNNP